MKTRTKSHLLTSKVIPFVCLFLLLLLSGCKSNPSPISIENIDQATWIKTYPMSGQGAWGDVVWTAEEAQLLVAGSSPNPDGSLGGYVRVWSVENEDGQSYDWRTMQGKTFKEIPIRSLALSPDGRRAALGTFTNVAMIWDMDAVPADESLIYMEGHTELVIRAVAWSPDGKLLATGGNDMTVRIWNVDKDIITFGSPIEEIKRFEATEKINCVSFSPNGKLIVIGTNNGLAAIDLETQVLVLEISGEPIAKLGQSLAWSSDGSRLAVGSSDGKVFIFPFAGGELNGSAEFLDISKTGMIIDLAFSPDGKMLAVAFPNVISIWDMEKQKSIQSFPNSADLKFTSVAWSPDGLYIATTYSDGTLRIIGISK